ncbi:MAG: dihydrofolate reductase [Candidatus Marinimicrobia bacterium]|nr:dihydrofolate reductase [Candidatus Neomarinimicrobiota bacterium]
MDVILIAAVTQDGYIARHSHERVTWSKDLHLFKEQTSGWPVIMGSNTFNCLQKELEGRDIIVVHRNDDPDQILAKLNSKKCFIAGGGKTNTRFAPYLTHLYLTPHPIIFGNGIRLFSDKVNEMNLFLEGTVAIKGEKELNQFIYRINCDIRHST